MSDALFDSLADGYDEHFATPFRRAYDSLAWGTVVDLLPKPTGSIIDAGCGTGRWCERLARMGHLVVGIESAPRMVEAARLRARQGSARYTVIDGRMEDVNIAERSAHLVLAMGSLQYSDDPVGVLGRFAEWVKPGGFVVVLVDSLVALVLELLAAGQTDEALERARTRRGYWDAGTDARPAPLYLFDRDSLEKAFARVGLTGVRSRGLLVSSSAIGPSGVVAKLREGGERAEDVERQLAEEPVLADAGKHILVVGRRAVGTLKEDGTGG